MSGVGIVAWVPVVRRRWLLLLAGGAWSAIGVLLCAFAYAWLSPVRHLLAAPLAGAGVAGSLAIYRFGFSRLALRNATRICALAEPVGILAFQEGRSYPLVGFMMGLGIALRSSPIPKPYLAVLYIGIGGGLLLSSLHYYGRVARTAAREPPVPSA